jgi:hypothetical protein
MKKIISIIAILLCFAASYAQETKPTKQETMDWIAGKMKLYLVRDEENKRFFQSYSNGVFVYIKYLKEYENYKSKSIGSIVYYIDLNKVTSVVTQQAFWKDNQDNITENYLRLVMKGNKLLRKDLTNYTGDDKEDIERYDDEVMLGYWDYEPDQVSEPLCNFHLELGLRERAIKAIYNLIIYNTNSSKEPY